MTCPGCALEIERPPTNPQWVTCEICGWQGHPTETVVPRDEPDEPEELDFYREA